MTDEKGTPIRYFLDTEFIEDGHTIELLSIGVVCEDGRTFYAENSEADKSRANDWVKANVLPHMQGPSYPYRTIATNLREWVAIHQDKPEFWAYYGDYDWVAICQMFGTMLDLPSGWPMFCMDLKQLAVSFGNPRLPKQTSTEHNALADAQWNADMFDWLYTLAARAPTL